MTSPAGVILGIDIPFGADDDAWVQANLYWVWTKRFPIADPPLRPVELIDGRINETGEASQILRLIPAGMAHRIDGLFGFWHTSDADTLFFRSEQGDDVRYALVVSAGSPDFKTDELFWTCPGCGNELTRATFDSRRHGYGAFWEFALERTRAFNADAAVRTCSACGAIHSGSYAFGDYQAARAAASSGESGPSKP